MPSSYLPSPPSPPPPLALRPADHPAFDQVLELAHAADDDDDARAGSIIWDVGCGFGRDLLELARRGVRPSRLVGIDTERQFASLALSQAQSAGFPALPYTFHPVDLFAYPPPLPADLPSRPRVIIVYRFFHLFPPAEHRRLLRTLVDLLDTSHGPAMILGLHRDDSLDRLDDTERQTEGSLAGAIRELWDEEPCRLRSYRLQYLGGPSEKRSAVEWQVIMDSADGGGAEVDGRL